MKRDYGLDIYKIIATFMVFILHVADQGGGNKRSSLCF